MGSAMKDCYGELDRQQREEETIKTFRKRAEFISEIEKTPYNEDIQWLWTNREKIIRNKKLINLIG